MTAKKAAVVEYIAVGKLLISPEESRKAIDQVALKELAASIEASGVQEPLIVRPLRAIFVEYEDGSSIDCPPQSREKCSEYLLDPKVVRAEVDDTFYEIVAGQRRLRASELAGKESCPCLVREMSDDEAREARIVSNLQREDLQPLDQAKAFAALMAVPGATVESVAAKLGKAPSFVGRRLKLLDAIDPVRQALAAGAIEVGHALELARLDEAQQRKFLDGLNVGWSGACRYCDCTEGDPCELEDEEGEYSGNCSWVDGTAQTVCSNPDCVEKMNAASGNVSWTPTRDSVAELRRDIAKQALTVLSAAPFPLDAGIAPMPCTECPKRTINAGLLFDDVAQDSCTDAECFKRKCVAWVRHELQAAEDEKRKLVMLADGWTDVNGAVTDYSVRVVGGGVKPCEGQEEAIYIDGRNIGQRRQICRDPKCKTHKGDSFSRSASSTGSSRSASLTPVQRSAAKEERSKLLAAVKAEKEFRQALFVALIKTPESELGSSADELLTEIAVEILLWRLDSTKKAQLAEACGIPERAFESWRDGGKALKGELAKRGSVERVLLARVAMEASELTVHEHDVPDGGALKKRQETDLEKLAKRIGLDVDAIRGGTPTSSKAKVEEATRKAVVKRAAEASSSKPATKKSVAKKSAKAVKKGQRAPAEKIPKAAREKVVAAQKKRWSALKTKKKGGAK